MESQYSNERRIRTRATIEGWTSMNGDDEDEGAQRLHFDSIWLYLERDVIPFMDRVCVTRAIKNAKYLQKVAPEIIPQEEPADGFASLVPINLLGKLHLAGPEARKIGKLS